MYIGIYRGWVWWEVWFCRNVDELWVWRWCKEIGVEWEREIFVFVVIGIVWGGKGWGIEDGEVLNFEECFVVMREL